jgi:hypothetical protein
MNNEEKLVCLCVRQNFTVANAAQVAAICVECVIDWPRLFDLAQYHLVAPLVYKNLQYSVQTHDLSIPAPILHRFKAHAIENTIHQRRRRQKLRELLGYLHDEGLNVMLVKGIALTALVYQADWYTCPDDIDLLLDRPKCKVRPEQRAVIASYAEHGIECDAFAHHDLNMNGILPVDFARIWHDARKIHFDGYPVYVMAPEDILVTLCISSARKRYFRLKAMFDIAETVTAYPQMHWQSVVDKAQTYDVAMIVYTALYLTQRYLGMPLPSHRLADLKLSPLRIRLIHQLCGYISLSAFTQLHTATRVHLLGRHLSFSAGLRYLTLRWYQIGCQLRFMLRTPRAQFQFWDGE